MKGEWVEDEEECGGGCVKREVLCVCVCVYERTECIRGVGGKGVG